MGGGRRIILAATAALLAAAAGAPAADATSVYWTGDYPRGGNVVHVESAPEETNDLVIVGSDGGVGSTRVVDVYDRAATLDDGGKTGTSGDCAGEPGDEWGSYYCQIPCRILSAEHARCVIDDGYANVQRPTNPLGNHWPYFRTTAVKLAGGADRVLTKRQTVGIDGGDGGNYYTLGDGGHVEASDNDDIRFLPGGSGGGVTIWGGGVTVHAIDGTEQSISCWHEPGTAPKLYLDTLDRLSNGAYCPDPVTPPKLPAL